jgi:choline dehydrogenase-like flavoprotein
MAFHPLGTARMAARPADGVLGPDGTVHGVPGLHVCDGAAVPGALGVNPQLTIMALATRLADRLLEA